MLCVWQWNRIHLSLLWFVPVLSLFRQHSAATFTEHRTNLDCKTAGVMRPRIPVVITESMVSHLPVELLFIRGLRKPLTWYCRLGSRQYNGLLLQWREIWAGIRTECLILKVNQMFQDFLVSYLGLALCWLMHFALGSCKTRGGVWMFVGILVVSGDPHREVKFISLCWDGRNCSNQV